MGKEAMVLGLPVHTVTMTEAVAKIRQALAAGLRMRVVTLNPEMVIAARRDPEFAAALCRGDLVVPDGYGVVWALRRSGHKGQERIAGVDLVENLFTAGTPGGLRIYLLGGAAGVAEAAAERIAARWSGVRVVGTAHGYFPPPAEDEVIRKINDAHPQVLLAGMGLPRQELWLAENWDKLQVTVGIGMGGALDLWAGKVKRAPYLLRKSRLEWLYRALQEPARFRRLLVLPGFVRLVRREMKLARRALKV
ncbi:MAG TPA: WecB/TagA/CpsF family glycosyltransferase [Firmicutes bacterium]|jgi:N-acetylglucosaminyldiphosphoundecaprenol N-acetyl-beta-D-mannosaminyltransferase|nr:WecB/TagA/CpsF family glycosyltransferase [Bacillota bacterium]